MVDARKYAAKYIKPDSVRDGPLTTRIIHVFEDERYARLNLELENGSTFGLNDKQSTGMRAVGLGSKYSLCSACIKIGKPTRHRMPRPSKLLRSQRRRAMAPSRARLCRRAGLALVVRIRRLKTISTIPCPFDGLGT